MKERDVRKALHAYIDDNLIDYQYNRLMVDELGVLEGKCRVDLAVIDNQLHGFEIKSASDNLERLPSQQATYAKVFDRMTLVCDQKHVQEAVQIVPKSWGLICVETKHKRPYLNEIWPSRRNFDVDPYSVCQLLWRDEALDLLRQHGMGYGFRTKSRKKMWRALADALPLDEIRKAVKSKLSKRIGWR